MTRQELAHEWQEWHKQLIDAGQSEFIGLFAEDPGLQVTTSVKPKNETEIRILNAYENLGIEEGFVRNCTNGHSIDLAEHNIRELAYKAVQDILTAVSIDRLFSRVLDIVKSENPWDVHEWLMKAETRHNGGDQRLDLILNLLPECFDDQELLEKSSEIINDYFMNYASSAQKQFIASDIVEMWQGSNPEAELPF